LLRQIHMNRRTFLMLSTSAALSAPSGILVGTGASRVRVGIASGTGNRLPDLQPLLSLPELEIAALSGERNLLLATRERILASTGIAPRIYPSFGAMMRNDGLELAFATAESEPALDSPVHLLLDMPADPLLCSARSHPERCIQILPRNEFLGSPRNGQAPLLGGDWTKAVIHHRTSLPRPKVSSPEDLRRWIWKEVGEAVDFSAELLDTREFPEVEATAAPGGSAGAVLFSLHLRNCEQSPPRSVEIHIHARADGPATPTTNVLLHRPSGRVSFYAAARSAALTRALVRNALDAISTRTPSKLLYSPCSLLAAQRALASIVGSLQVVS
jgi:hypothetical protein